MGNHIELMSPVSLHNENQLPNTVTIATLHSFENLQDHSPSMKDFTAVNGKMKDSFSDAGQPNDDNLGSTHIVVEGSKELAKPFRLWSTLGMQFSVSSTPLSLGTYLSFVIGIGGSPVFFFGYLLACVMGLCVCTSLAEIAAVYPHASGT